ncbi:hypothetical protein PQU92_08715 [Asticcacaulis sp. BYS171W]|uniref:UrcA family protein n=1 Tax=Asticcacaulis aquaticus TaxID=2984212 RepID=A0ABT5HTG5_9CAUL|nr:hypothetical protein [Asticcacaulis aquaticus]MDC7683356.1 hypothetical protein [Asticcacaulis aquaticus]
MRVVLTMAAIATWGLGAATAVMAQSSPTAYSENYSRMQVERDYQAQRGLFDPHDASGRMPYNGLPSAGELRQKTRTVFLAAQTQKANGKHEAACRSMRKAIALDKRYQKAKVRGHVRPVEENYDDLYRDLETEYCAAVRS